MNRAINEEVFVKIIQFINGFKDYFLRYDQVIYENPSPRSKIRTRKMTTERLPYLKRSKRSSLS